MENAWKVGDFKQGQVVKCKRGHPLSMYGNGVIQVKLSSETVKVWFYNVHAKGDVGDRKPQGDTVAVLVADLEAVAYGT